MGSSDQNRIVYFPECIAESAPPPERFTFPFYYKPHPLAEYAAGELQHFLEEQATLQHNFGLTPDAEGMAIGKMFGVLVVKDKDGRLGYLWGFSGKLAGTNDHSRFVPPVFDMLTENSFFLEEQEVIDGINRQIEELEADENFIRLQEDLPQLAARSETEIAAVKKQLKENKQQRDTLRDEKRQQLSAEDYNLLEDELVKQSLSDKRLLKQATGNWNEVLESLHSKLAVFNDRIESLKNERKERSAALQNRLFEQYTFLNKAGVSKSLQEIFKNTAFGRPPSAAGECATPKLLQYAFANGHTPLAMAEFWWGASPRSEVRKHRQFYPACTGKCKPILAHMLEGIAVDENPFLLPAGSNIQLRIIYEDEYLLVVNKPAGLRSVPGVDIDDSVYSRLISEFGVSEPYIVHRLDMGTSGLLAVAKDPKVHKHLQKQFLNRTVAKQYTAMVSKAITQEEGEIKLPLTADPFNRPLQLVCFDTGKKTITRWKVVERNRSTTKIHFWPLTGRTHQLRVHSAHHLGLNAPIVGDDLYGTSADRMYLHAAHIAFVHPITKERMAFEVKEEF